MNNHEVLTYFKLLSEKISNKKKESSKNSSFHKFPLPTSQCYYIIDYKKNQIISQFGIKDVLGYSEKEFNIEKVINIIHPDDSDILSRLIKATLKFASENDASQNVSLYVTYRVKHKNGSFIKILRQSYVYEYDEDGRIISAISILSNVNFLCLSDMVCWKFDAPGLDQIKFKKYISDEYASILSTREKDIIHLMNKGYTSQQISDKLFISKHTVDTHRRKMLHKTGSRNSIELINYCKTNGMI